MEQEKPHCTIDNIFNDLLKRIPQLTSLVDTGLSLEKESIDNLSSNLDKMFSIQVEIDECEYLDFWEIVCAPLIIHALRYLEFRHLEYKQDFTLAREVILDGNLESLEEMEFWGCPSIDSIQIIKLIYSCWVLIKEPDYYSTFNNEQILEIIREIRARIKGYKNIDLEKDIEESIKKSTKDEIIKDSLTNTIQSLKKNPPQSIEPPQELKENDKNKEKDPDETTLIPNNSLSAIELIPHVMKSLGYDPLAYPSFRGFKKIVHDKAKDEHSIIFRMSFESFYKGQNSTFNKAEGRGLIKKKL